MRAFMFEISGEQEVIKANTVIHALKFYNDLTGLGFSDFEDEDDIYEFPKSKWKDYKIQDEDGGTTTLEKEMETSPCPSLICSSVE